MHSHSRRAALALFLALPLPLASASQGCQWMSAAPLAQTRMESHAVVADGRLYMFGGFHNVQHQASARHDVFDPASGAWTRLADMPEPLTHAGFALDGDTIWVAGGFVGPHPGPVTAAVWRYSIPADAWTAGPPLPAPRGSGALVRLGRALHFFGGVLPDRNTDSADHWVLDLQAPAAGWSARAPMPLPRNHLAGIEAGGRVLALGGQFRHDVSPVDVPHMHAYEPGSDQWTALAPLPFGRSHFEAAVSVVGGQLLIAGGRARGLGLEALPDLTLYDLQTGVSQGLAPLPQPLLAPTALLMGGRLHVVGGGDPTQPLAAHRIRAVSVAPFQVARLNAGGAAWAAPAGADWCGDFGFLGGQTYSNPLVTAIAHASDPTLYLSERSGSNALPQTLAYRIPVEDGLYRVRLHFAEIYWGAPGGGPGGAGRRVFDVALEGVAVLDDYDILARVGPAAADVHTFDLAVAGGALDVSMAASQDRPKVSAIEVLPLAPGSFGPTCPGGINSTGVPAVLGLIGSTSLGDHSLRLACDRLPSGQAAVFAMSPGAASVAFGGGTLCLAPPIHRLTPALLVPASGSLQHVLGPLGSAVQPGSTWHFQVHYRDAAGGADNLSNGLSVLFQP